MVLETEPQHAENTHFLAKIKKSRTYATNPGQTTIGPDLHVLITWYLDISGIEILVQQRKIENPGWWDAEVKIATWKSYVLMIQTTIPQVLICWSIWDWKDLLQKKENLVRQRWSYHGASRKLMRSSWKFRRTQWTTLKKLFLVKKGSGMTCLPINNSKDKAYLWSRSLKIGSSFRFDCHHLAAVSWRSMHETEIWSNSWFPRLFEAPESFGEVFFALRRFLDTKLIGLRFATAEPSVAVLSWALLDMTLCFLFERKWLQEFMMFNNRIRWSHSSRVESSMQQSGLSFSSLCFENNLLLVFDILQLPGWDCLELLPFLAHCWFRIRNFVDWCTQSFDRHTQNGVLWGRKRNDYLHSCSTRPQCVCIWLGQVAKLLDASAEWRMSCAFRTGKDGKIVDWKGDVEVDVQEQQRRVKHEIEKARWRGMIHVQQTPFWHDLSLTHACTCTRMKMCKCDCARAMCRKMCVQQVSVCTPPVVHTVVATTCVRNPKKTLSRKNQHSSLHDHFWHKIFRFVVWVRKHL